MICVEEIVHQILSHLNQPNLYLQRCPAQALGEGDVCDSAERVIVDGPSIVANLSYMRVFGPCADRDLLHVMNSVHKARSINLFTKLLGDVDVNPKLFEGLREVIHGFLGRVFRGS